MPLDDAISALNLLRPASKLIPIAGPYLEGTVDLLLEGCSIAQDAASNKEDLLALAEHAVRCMIVVIEKAQTWSEPEIDSRMRAIRELESLTEGLQQIARKRIPQGIQSTFRSTLIDKSDVDDLNKRFGQIAEKFGVEAQLVMTYDIGEVLERGKELQDNQRQIKEEQIRVEQAQIRTEQNALLDKLRPVTTARYDHQNSPRGCTENTRVNIIDRIFNWALDKSAPESILWLSGLAGTGKTAIMKTLSVMLAEEGVLGGCFFISLQYTDSRDPQNVFRSLIHQLAEFQPALREPICSVLRDHTAVVDQEMAVQIPKVLSEIFARMDYQIERPIAIMIDALDECEKRDDVEGGQFLPILSRMVLQYPEKLKLIISSRLIPKIQEVFVTIPTQQLKLHEIDDGTIASDIELYLKVELQRITQSRGLENEPDWYTSADIAKFVTLSGNLFIYAFTVVAWINHPNFRPKDRLHQLLRWRPHNGLKSPYAKLYDFYTLILRTALGFDPSDHDETRERIQPLLELLVVAFRPLSVPELAGLLKRDQSLVRLDLDHLSSVLLVPEKDSTDPVIVYHASFIEYLTDSVQFPAKPPLQISVWEAHGRVGLYCLNLRYSHVKNSYANDGADSETITEIAIDYAYRCWKDHILLSPISGEYVVQAIGEARKMTSVRSEDTSFLFDLSFLLDTHSNRDDSIEIIHERITIDRRLRSSLLPSDPSWCGSLNNLTTGLRSLYGRNGRHELLDEAIEILREVLETYPPGHPYQVTYLNNLASGLLALYEHNGKHEVLEEAVQLYRQSLEFCPVGHPIRDMYMSNLALGLWSLYRCNGKQELLNEAVCLHREALGLRPPGHPNRETSMNNLALGLLSLYERNENQELLDEAIQLHREALELCPRGHPGRDMSLNNLALGLETLYQCNEKQEVLDEVIQLNREALELRLPGHPERSTSLNSLALALLSLYKRNWKQELLDEAIQLHRAALELCPPGHPIRDIFVNNLVTELVFLYRHNGNQELFHEVVQLLREVLEQVCPPGHPRRATSLANLAYLLCLQYEQTKSAALIEEVVQLEREALSLCSPTDIDYARRLRVFGNSLNLYSTAFEDDASAEEAKRLFEQANSLESTV